MIAETVKVPPKLAQKLLSISLPIRIRQAIVGDLVEEYQIRSSQHHPLMNDLWFWKQSLSSSYEFINKQSGIPMAFIFSILFFICTVLLTFGLAGDLALFIDVPAFILTFPIAVLFGLVCTSWQSCKLAIKLCVSQQEGISNAAYQKAKAFFRITGNSGLLLGWLMTLIGWVAIGSNMETEVLKDLLGPAFAVSILTLVYAIILKILCYVGEQRLLSNPPLIDDLV